MAHDVTKGEMPSPLKALLELIAPGGGDSNANTLLSASGAAIGGAGVGMSAHALLRDVAGPGFEGISGGTTASVLNLTGINAISAPAPAIGEGPKVGTGISV